MTTGRLLIGATPLGQPSDASARAGQGPGERRCDRRRGHPPDPHLGPVARGQAGRQGGGLYDANESSRVPALIGEIGAGATVPAGQRRRHAADQRSGLSAGGGLRRSAGQVHCLPGPSAVTTALAMSGLPVGEVLLRGVRAAQALGARVLAQDAGRRAAHVRVLRVTAAARRSACVTRSTHLGPGRRAVVCRELTKTHEEIVRGTLGELADWASEGVLGEITVVLVGAPPKADLATLVAEVNVLVDAGARVKDACAEVIAANPGSPSRRELYDAVLRFRGLAIRTPGSDRALSRLPPGAPSSPKTSR